MEMERKRKEVEIREERTVREQRDHNFLTITLDARGVELIARTNRLEEKERVLSDRKRETKEMQEIIESDKRIITIEQDEMSRRKESMEREVLTMESMLVDITKRAKMVEEREERVKKHDIREIELNERARKQEKREKEFFEHDAGNIVRKWKKKTMELERMTRDQRLTIESLKVKLRELSGRRSGRGRDGGRNGGRDGGRDGGREQNAVIHAHGGMEWDSSGEAAIDVLEQSRNVIATLLEEERSMMVDGKVGDNDGGKGTRTRTKGMRTKKKKVVVAVVGGSSSRRGTFYGTYNKEAALKRKKQKQVGSGGRSKGVKEVTVTL